MSDASALPHRAAIGLGSNLGDRHGHIQAALRGLDRAGGLRVDAVSPVMETDPVGPPGQRPYLNAACVVRTSRSPLALLSLLRRSECRRGRDRVRGTRWGPRTLDLDLLLYDDLVLEHAALSIPHPRLHERAFVLVPLAEIAPDWVVPTMGATVQHLLNAVRDAPGSKDLQR